MRYILVGSHGTGKTTLCKALKSSHEGLVIRDGISRPMKVCREKLRLSAFEEQVIINELTFFYWDYNKDFNELMMTRSPIDCAAYSYALGFNSLGDECMKRIRDSGILDERNIEYYYLPIEFELEDDGVRFMDKEFQKRVDKELISVLEELGITYTTITGSVEDRIKFFKLK